MTKESKDKIEKAANIHAKHPIQDNHATAIYFADIGYDLAVRDVVEWLRSLGENYREYAVNLGLTIEAKFLKKEE